MTPVHCSDEFLRFYQLVSKGDASCYEFLVAWHSYTHRVDDIIDTFLPPPDQVLAVFASAIQLYTLPYFRAHCDELKPMALQATSSYALSVRWETSDDKWQRKCADVMRHCGLEMVYACAEIQGGWEWRQAAVDLLAPIVMRDRNEPED